MKRKKWLCFSSVERRFAKDFSLRNFYNILRLISNEVVADNKSESLCRQTLRELERLKKNKLD
jgi:hypothetical protein